MSREPIPTPFVAIDRQRMLANIESMAERAKTLGVALRPHAKTHKSASIGRRQVQAGAIGLTVATISEAVAFAKYGFDDLFIAYPIWLDEDRSHRLHHLLEDAVVRIGIDSIEAAQQLKPHAGERLSVAVEIDSGHHRSGVSPDAAGRIAAAAAEAGLRVDGVFTFPGHSYSPALRRQAARDEATALAAAAAALQAAGVPSSLRSGGSSPSAALVQPGELTELRPGVYVFGDAQQLALGSIDEASIALQVHSTVVSTAGGRVVLDAGSKVLGTESPDYVEGFGYLPEHPEARIVRLSEHHAVCEWPGVQPALGERVRIIPNHVCMVVNNVDTLIVVDDGEPSDNWPVIARGCNL